MGGITGFTHCNEAAEPGRIRAATRTLTHRGPAKQGVWEDELVSLGSVASCADAAAPSAGDDAAVCFDGEIHNREELRAALEGCGHPAAGADDATLARLAFQQWSEGAFARMRGPFAAAFWIPSRRSLTLVRDRLGSRPLYFARRRGDLYFGSELKALLAHPELPRNLDVHALTDYLAVNYVPGPRTLIDGIRKLAPGTWLRWELGNVTTGVYWRLQMQPDGSLDFETARRELDRLLIQATRDRMPREGPVCVWLNTALDCTSVLHYAEQTAPGRLKTFGALFPGRSPDLNREIAGLYGAEHIEVELEPNSDFFNEVVYYSDEPGGDIRGSVVWYIAQATRPYSHEALCGRGADQVFGCSRTYLADRYAQALRAIPEALRKGAARLAGRLPAPSGFRLGDLLEGSLLDPANAHFLWEGSRSKSHSEIGIGGLPRVPEDGGVNRFLTADQLYFLPDDLLSSFDRMGLAHSVVARLPFLDHRVVEFAARLPEDFKVNGNRTGVLLSALMKDRLPKAMLERRNTGFTMPVDDWFRTTLRPALIDAVTEENVAACGVLEWPAIDASVKAHLEGRANLGYHLWGLVVLLLWMKRWGVLPPSRTVDTGSVAQPSLAV